MTKEFYDRKIELSLLKEKYEKLQKGEFLAIYGRRRVGKTELIKEFLTKIPANNKFYFYVDLSSKQEILNSISVAVAEQLGETVQFSNFSNFLDYIHKKAKSGKFVLVIDEFQRFLDIAPDYITKLQDKWDSELQHSRVMIILVGSSIGMIKKITESKAGALYGRAIRIKISPFKYADFRLMFKNLNEEEKVERFAVFGGTPYYLDKTKNMENTKQAIYELVLKKGGELVEEPKTLLEYENVRTHARYNSILHAIASGKEILKEMEDITSLPLTTMPAYLNRLDELLDLVGKHDPIFGKERLGRYTIKDNFFKFWYKFIFSNQTTINLGNDKLVLKIIYDNLNAYVGKIFEDISKELLALYLNKKIKGVEIDFENIGSWWNRKGDEIDIVAYNQAKRKIFVGEVKWTNQPCGEDILNRLIEKSKLINYSGAYQYIIISKSGFTQECLAKMGKLNVLNIDLKEMAQLFDAVE